MTDPECSRGGTAAHGSEGRETVWAVAAFSPLGYVVVSGGKVLTVNRKDGKTGGPLVEPGGAYGPVQGRWLHARIVLSLADPEDHPDNVASGSEQLHLAAKDADILRSFGFPIRPDNLVWLHAYRMQIRIDDPLELAMPPLP